jgi:hypothetical protein
LRSAKDTITKLASNDGHEKIVPSWIASHTLRPQSVNYQATRKPSPYCFSSLEKQLGPVHVSIFFHRVDIFDHAFGSVVTRGSSRWAISDY